MWLGAGAKSKNHNSSNFQCTLYTSGHECWETFPPRVPRTTRTLIRTKWLLKLNQCNFSKSEQLLLKITGWCIEKVFVVFAYFICLFLNNDNCLLFTVVSVIVPQQSTSFNFIKSFSCAPNGHFFWPLKGYCNDSFWMNYSHSLIETILLTIMFELFRYSL